MTGSHYMGWVAQLCCALCPIWPVEVHHRRAGTGGGRRASDFDTIPLCTEHHRGDSGVHGLGTKAFARVYAVSEAELVLRTQARCGVSVDDVLRWQQEARDRSRRAKARRALRPRVKGQAAVVTRWPKRKIESRGFAGARPLRSA